MQVFDKLETPVNVFTMEALLVKDKKVDCLSMFVKCEKQKVSKVPEKGDYVPGGH